MSRQIEPSDLKVDAPTTIFDLPTEINHKIFGPLIAEATKALRRIDPWNGRPQRAKVWITIGRSHPPRWYGGRRRRPKLFHSLRGLLKAFAGTPLEVFIAESVSKDFSYVSELSESLRHMPVVMDPRYMRYIQKLTVCVDENTKVAHEMIWPSFITVICDNLPNLTKLTLVTNTKCIDTAFEKLDDISLAKFYAPLLRLLAFVAHRIQDKFRLILPAKQSPKYASPDWFWDSHCEHVRVTLEKSVPCSRDERWLQAQLGRSTEIEAPRVWKKGGTNGSLNSTEDEILNTTAIRRLTMAELEKRAPKTFIIKPKTGSSKNTILSSEVHEKHNFYAAVDTRGYKSWECHQENQWKKRTVDEMVLFCRAKESEYKKRRHHARQAKQNKLQTQLARSGLNVHAQSFVPTATMAHYPYYTNYSLIPELIDNGMV